MDRVVDKSLGAQGGMNKAEHELLIDTFNTQFKLDIDTLNRHFETINNEISFQIKWLHRVAFAGAMIAVLGFNLWWYRVQRHADAKLLAEAKQGPGDVDSNPPSQPIASTSNSHPPAHTPIDPSPANQ